LFTVKIKKLDPFSLIGTPDDDGKGTVCYRHCTKLIEATDVAIHTLRPGELYGISGTTGDGKKFYYYIADPDVPQPADITKADSVTGESLFGYEAYIENSAGATTEVVKF
jgi:hypothetical protein